MASAADGPAPQRIDKWLWHARFLRTRSASAAFVADGRVRVTRPNGGTERLARPSQVVRPGDILTLALDGAVRTVRVVGCAARRDSPAAARQLYEELPESL